MCTHTFLLTRTHARTHTRMHTHTHRLAKLPEGFECGPFFAHKCLLSGLQPLSRFSNVAPPSWSAKAITQLKNFVFSEGDDDGANVTMRVGWVVYVSTPFH